MIAAAGKMDVNGKTAGKGWSMIKGCAIKQTVKIQHYRGRRKENQVPKEEETREKEDKSLGAPILKQRKASLMECLEWKWGCRAKNGVEMSQVCPDHPEVNQLIPPAPWGGCCILEGIQDMKATAFTSCWAGIPTTPFSASQLP